MAKQIDPRSDIFSLGVLAYELLTGESAFQGESLSEIIQKVVQETPPPPSSIDPGIPASLDEAVMKAMEKDPAKRHPDMKAFEDALVSAVDDSDAGGTIPGVIVPPEPAGKSWRTIRAFLMWQLCSWASCSPWPRWPLSSSDGGSTSDRAMSERHMLWGSTMHARARSRQHETFSEIAGRIL